MLVVVAFLSVSSLVFAQTNNEKNVSGAKTTANLPVYEQKLINAYNDLIAKMVIDSDIDQEKKTEILTWQPKVHTLNGENFIACLVFPQGTMTIDKNCKVQYSLSKSFDVWSGFKSNWNILYITGFTNSLEYRYKQNESDDK